MLSDDMADFLYRQMRDMRNSDAEGSTVIGEARISGQGVIWAVLFFLLWHMLTWIWIVSGGTVWKGYQETSVRANEGWTATPLSSPLLDRGFSFNLPFLARAGEEMVFDYEHDSDFVATAGAFPVRAYVSCFLGCSAKDSQSLTVEKAGKGQAVVVLPRTSLYQIRIIQKANRDGSTSRGFFWWGLRSQQPGTAAE
jgi:hypothetical protein